MAKKAVLQLETLTCPTCIKKIETALSKVDGVRSAKVLFNSSKVKAEYDEAKTTAEDLQSVIRNLGYAVLSVKES